MSQTHESEHGGGPTTEAGHGSADLHAGHPSDWTYIKVALVLGLITAIEVGLYYFNIGSLNNTALFVLSAVKFATVVLYFMHLRFDHPMLRRLFVTGVILAFFCYIAYLTTLHSLVR